MFLVTTTHAGSLVSAGSSLCSPEAAAASEQRLWHPQHSGGFAEGEEPSGCSSPWLGAGDGLVQVQLLLNPSGHSGLAPVHFLFVCFFTSFGG